MMKVFIFDWLRDLRASYWFIPSIMAATAALLSFGLTTIDGWVGSDWFREVGWLYANQPEGARAVLSTIAGSMITVAGVTFSMTIVTVSFAAGQIGPRLMNNFMRDRGNQITLGTFIATFLYCLLVLRTVHSANETNDAVSAFVPHLAIMVGLLLAVASVGVLIFFIHHVPESINVSHVVANVGSELNQMVERLFPVRMGEPMPDDAPPQAQDTEADFAERFASARAVVAKRNGYIRAIDNSALMRLAEEYDTIIRLEYRPGDFISEGKTLLYVECCDDLSDEALERYRDTFAMGSQRTPYQNIFFLIDELVEIAVRALSPGVNDPFTAVSCMHWLQSVLSKLANRQPPASVRCDDQGKARVIAHPLAFEHVADRAFDQLRQYVSSDRIAVLEMMRVIAEVGVDTDDRGNRSVLQRHAQALEQAAQVNMTIHQDYLDVTARFQQVCRLLEHDAGRDRLRDEQGWLGGSA